MTSCDPRAAQHGADKRVTPFDYCHITLTGEAMWDFQFSRMRRRRSVMSPSPRRGGAATRIGLAPGMVLPVTFAIAFCGGIPSKRRLRDASRYADAAGDVMSSTGHVCTGSQALDRRTGGRRRTGDQASQQPDTRPRAAHREGQD